MIFRILGCILGHLFPVAFLRKVQQAFNYVRSGYASVSVSGLSTVLLEKNVQLIGRQCIKLAGGGVIKTGTRIEAWTSFAGETFSPTIEIGKHVHIGVNCHITAINCVQIGDDVLFGSNVLVSDNNHGSFYNDYELPPIKRQLSFKGETIIGNKVWLGDNVVVLSGVNIGNNSIIGANSVVTKDIPPFSIAVGSPARVIKTISQVVI